MKSSTAATKASGSSQRLRRLVEVTGRPLDAPHLLELQLALLA